MINLNVMIVASQQTKEVRVGIPQTVEREHILKTFNFKACYR